MVVVRFEGENGDGGVRWSLRERERVREGKKEDGQR